MRYLESNFDDKLKGNNHIHSLCINAIVILQSLAEKSIVINWWNGPETLKMNYKGAIVPLLS